MFFQCDFKTQFLLCVQNGVDFLNYFFHGCYGADWLGFSDVKFLQLHEGASEETVFCWKVNTK